MEGGKQYRVCDNIFRDMKGFKVPWEKMICYAVDTVILSRDER